MTRIRITDFFYLQKQVAGGNATPVVVNNTVVRPAETNGHVDNATPTPANDNQNKDIAMDLTYSFFPPAIELPNIPSNPQLGAGNAVERVPEDTTLTNTQASTEDTNKGDLQNKEKEAVLGADPEQSQNPLTLPDAQNLSNGTPVDADKEPESENNSKKRKRPPTPDVIPNPPGCSYGLHDDYFTYSDEEIEEWLAQEAAKEAAKAAEATATGFASTAARATSSTVAAPVAERPEKRARFLSSEDSSDNIQSKETTTNERTTPWNPPIPPGWSRPTTTVYTGDLFKSMRTPSHTPFTPEPPSTPTPFYDPRLQNIEFRSMEDTGRPPRELYPATGSLSDLKRNRSIRKPLTKSGTIWKPLNSIVNSPLGTPGRFQSPRMPIAQPLTTPSLSRQPASSVFRNEPASQQQPAAMSAPETHPLSQPQLPRPDANNANAIPTTSNGNAQTAILPEARHDTNANNTVPTTPNGSVETTSLPPIVQTLPAASKGQASADTHKPNNPSRLRNAMRLSSSPISQPSPISGSGEAPQQDLMQVFGNDQFGRQAYDIYKSCPSGDLNQVQWPGFESLPADRDQQFMHSTAIEENQQRFRSDTFQTSFAQFQNEFDQGLVDPDEILNDLPL